MSHKPPLRKWEHTSIILLIFLSMLLLSLLVRSTGTTPESTLPSPQPTAALTPNPWGYDFTPGTHLYSSSHLLSFLSLHLFLLDQHQRLRCCVQRWPLFPLRWPLRRVFGSRRGDSPSLLSLTLTRFAHRGEVRLDWTCPCPSTRREATRQFGL